MPTTESTPAACLAEVVHPSLLPGVGKPLSQAQRKIEAEEKQEGLDRSGRRHLDRLGVEVKETGEIDRPHEQTAGQIDAGSDRGQDHEGVAKQVALQIALVGGEGFRELVLGPLAQAKISRR